jgi:hypothetical protein
MRGLTFEEPACEAPLADAVARLRALRGQEPVRRHDDLAELQGGELGQHAPGLRVVGEASERCAGAVAQA